MPTSKRILLIIGGGIAAYKSLDLIRRLKERGCAVRTVMTKAAVAKYSIKMTAYKGSLSTKQIQNVAAFVYTSTHK